MARTKQRARKANGGRLLRRAPKGQAKAVHANADGDEENATQSVISDDEDRDQDMDEEDDSGLVFSDDSWADSYPYDDFRSPEVTDQGLGGGDAEMDKASSELSDVPSDLEGELGRPSKIKAEPKDDAPSLEGDVPSADDSKQMEVTSDRASREPSTQGAKVSRGIPTMKIEHSMSVDMDEKPVIKKHVLGPHRASGSVGTMGRFPVPIIQNAREYFYNRSKRAVLGPMGVYSRAQEDEEQGPMHKKRRTAGAIQNPEEASEIEAKSSTSSTPPAQLRSISAPMRSVVDDMSPVDAFVSVSTEQTAPREEDLPSAVSTVSGLQEALPLGIVETTRASAASIISSSGNRSPMPAAQSVVAEMSRPLPASQRELPIPSTANISRKMIDDFRAGTESDASDELVQQYLDAAGGNLILAARAYDKASKSVQPAEVTARDPPPAGVPTLVEEALEAMAKSKKPRKDIGDVLVVLDGQDLGRSIRLSSDDLRSASPLFKEAMGEDPPALGSTDPVDGIRFVCILEQPAEKNGMPLLCRKALNALQQDCKDQFYAQTDVKIKAEDPHQNSDLTVDWLDAYRSFFRIVSRLPVRFFEKGPLDPALPKLESIAHIANHYRAVGTRSPVTREVDNLFRRYILDGVLWTAIAKEPARWLTLASNLENEMVFKEAFVHLAGKYPDHTDDGQATVTIPENIMENIKTKSRDLYYHRKDIDSQLLSLTIKDKQQPWALAVIDTWRNWIATHIRIMAPQRTQPISISETESLLCGDRLRFPSLNQFYAAISKGRDAYFPADKARGYYKKNYPYPTAAMDIHAVKMFDEAFNAIKTEAMTVVKSLVESSLKGGAEELEYLTSILVEEEHIPWEREVKGEDGGACDDDDDDDMHF